MEDGIYINSNIKEALALVTAAQSMCKTHESWDMIATVLDVAHTKVNAVVVHLELKNSTRLSALEGMNDDNLHG